MQDTEVEERNGTLLLLQKGGWGGYTAGYMWTVHVIVYDDSKGEQEYASLHLSLFCLSCFRILCKTNHKAMPIYASIIT